MFQVWGWSAIRWCGGHSEMPFLASVWPPWCQGSWWWYSIHAGGLSQLWAAQPLVAVVDRDLLVAVEQPLLPADVERHRVPAEHHRDDPGPARQPAGLAGGDPAAGVGDRDPDPGHQGVVPDRDDQGERGPVDAGQVGQVVLDQLHQPVPEQRRVRELLPGLRVQPALADPPRRRERLQRLLQQVRVQGGELERALAGAVAVVADREVRQRPGLGLVLLQLAALGLVGSLGADHLEQPLAQLPQLGASNSVARSSMCASARSRVPSGRSSCSSVSASTAAVTTRAFSASIRPAASARRVAWNRSSSFSARCRSRNAAVLAGLGRVRQPRRRRGRPGVGADLVAVRRDQHPQPQLDQPGLGPGQLHQRLALLGRGHRPRRRVGQPVQRSVQRPGEPDHRMRRPRHHPHRVVSAEPASRTCPHARSPPPPPSEQKSEPWTTRPIAHLWTKTGSEQGRFAARRRAGAARSGRHRPPGVMPFGPCCARYPDSSTAEAKYAWPYGR